MSAPLKARGCGLILVLALLFAGFASTAATAETWQGVDETVVERYAKEQGRESREPVINTDQGDLLLFLFLLAGAAGGFAAGYYWRTLTERRTAPEKRDGHASS